MELTNLQAEPERTAATRSRLYQLLAVVFAFPNEDLFTAYVTARSPGRGAPVRALPYDLTGAATLELGAVRPSYAEFESEYIRLFDVGAAGPPCPLYGGVYVGDRMKVMEDATRFYNFFYLRLSPHLRELPGSHHHRAGVPALPDLPRSRGAAAWPRPAPLLRAQRDFLARHLCKWVPRLHTRLAKQTTPALLPGAGALRRRVFRAGPGVRRGGEC